MFRAHGTVRAGCAPPLCSPPTGKGSSFASRILNLVGVLTASIAEATSLTLDPLFFQVIGIVIFTFQLSRKERDGMDEGGAEATALACTLLLRQEGLSLPNS